MRNVAVSPHPRRRPAAWALATALLLPACDTGPRTAATVKLDVPTSSILVGQSVQVTPTVRDASGKTLLNRPISYQSSTPTVVAVSTTGLVLGLRPGSGSIIATVDAVSERLSFVVAPVPVFRVRMSRDTAVLAAPTTLQLTATPLDSAANALHDRTIEWRTSDAGIAGVSGVGLVSAVAPGAATITATIEGKSATTRLTVTPAPIASIEVTPDRVRVQEGNDVRLTAITKDAAGRVLTGRTLTWTSSDTNTAKVDGSGLVHGVAPGAANVLASADGAWGGAAVLVAPIVVASVTISPDTVQLEVDDTAHLTATVKDAAAQAVTLKPVTWRTLDPTLAIVDGPGRVIALALGTAGIVASCDNVADTAWLQVVPPRVASITLSPAPANLGVGRTGRLVVTLQDAAGNVLSGQRVRYAVMYPAVASVDTTGLLTGLNVGSTNLTVTAGKTSTATLVAVVPTPVGIVEASPTSIAFGARGDSRRIDVTIKDAAGNLLSARTMTFITGDPDVVAVSATGMVQAVGPGSTTVTVISEGVLARVDVTVP